MASTFKTFLSDDIANTRTLLHESVPITGSIINTVVNIKEYGHGMFQSVYDYTYTNSSANHIFDITYGHHEDLSGLVPADDFYKKRKNIYNQMAQVLVGHDVSGAIRKFDQDGDLAGIGDAKYDSLVFLNFARLLGKDEIKKGTFSLQLGTSPLFADADDDANHIVITDTGANSDYRVNSPAGEYGILKATSSVGQGLEDPTPAPRCGLIFYQAGVIALSTDIFNEYDAGSSPNGLLTGADGDRELDTASSFTSLITGNSTMNTVSTGVRKRILDVSFSNTTELNSTIYFCRVGHNDFNYSSNPTYLENSKVRVKNRASDAPVSYITTVGLYSAKNELLAVAKLSEPLRKDPTNDITLRVRLDY